MFHRQALKCRSSDHRRGSATVEFAVIAPVFVALALTAAQSSFNVDTTHAMYAAIRQAGRLASMNYDGRLLPGQTLNDKVILDIRNQLKAEGLPGDQMTITITGADGNQTFDLSDPDNELELYRVKIDVPYTAVNALGTFSPTTEKLGASVVFRLGKKSLVN